jgi:hypothetical protein
MTLAACTDMNPEPQQDASLIADECGDLLSQFGTKPDALEFLDCTAVHAPQVRFSARYRVPGNQAEMVEDFLHTEYGMNKLQFVCCGWEPKDGVRGSLTVPRHYFSLTMHSDETLMNDRTRWGDLPFFYVVVEEWINI